MADQVVTIKSSFHHKHLKKGRHTFVLPLDPDIESLIGKVIVYWGALEYRMDLITAEAAKVMGEHLPPGWRKRQFVKRRALFKSTLTSYAKQMFPAWVEGLRQLSDSAGDLHWRRNIVAHGYYEIEPITGGDTYRFKAYGEVKGQRRCITIDEETLSKLWHDIAHLLGDLMVFINHTGAKTSALDLVIPDDDLLGPDAAGSFRLLAVSDKLPPAPNPSEK